MKLGKVIATPWRANPGCLLRGFSSCVRRVDPSPAGPGAPPTFWSPSTRQRGPRRMLELPMWRRRWTMDAAVCVGSGGGGRRSGRPEGGGSASGLLGLRNLEVAEAGEARWWRRRWTVDTAVCGEGSGGTVATVAADWNGSRERRQSMRIGTGFQSRLFSGQSGLRWRRDFAGGLLKTIPGLE
jgi:hypothetical protein